MSLGLEKLSPELSHELIPHIREHCQEVYGRWGLPDGSTTVDPPWKYWLALESENRFFVIVLRDDDGGIQGYSAVSITRHQHIDVEFGYVEATWINPQLRGTLASKALMDYTTRIPLENGAKYVYFSVPPKLADHLENQGWRKVEVGCIFSR